MRGGEVRGGEEGNEVCPHCWCRESEYSGRNQIANAKIYNRDFYVSVFVCACVSITNINKLIVHLIAASGIIGVSLSSVQATLVGSLERFPVMMTSPSHLPPPPPPPPPNFRPP